MTNEKGTPFDNSNKKRHPFDFCLIECTFLMRRYLFSIVDIVIKY